MSLFLLASIPLAFIFVILLPWDPALASQRVSLVSTFLKGALWFVPVYLVVLIARGIIGFSHQGFWLFASVLSRDYLLPVLGCAGGFMLVARGLQLPHSEEGIYLVAFSFICGFWTPFSLTDFVATVAHRDANVLFLIPTMRLAGTVFLALAAWRFYRWEGLNALAFLGTAAAIGVVGSLPSYLFMLYRVALFVPLAVLGFAAAVLAFAARFPRALRD